MPAQVNAMTVDVEDYFQVQAFASNIDRAEWEIFPSRVRNNTFQILESFDRAGVRATFFTLGWVAERYPEIVREIVAGGHEVASHGYGHELVHELSPAAFRADVLRAKQVLEDIGGAGVRGYRAPTFSIGSRNPWAFDVLAETGHSYSSSVYPVKHDLYGFPAAPRFPYKPTNLPFVEIPLTTLNLRQTRLPISGGGYFRLTPYWMFKRALAHYSGTEGKPAVFYFHPWEVDADQPRVRGATRLAKFRHYVNIAAMPRRLERLLRDFRWGRMDDVFSSELASIAG